MSPNSRRRLSTAAASLSGLLSPRYTSGPSSPSHSQRVTSRSLSPPTSPDHKEQRAQAREQRRQQRKLATSRSREASPDQNTGGTAPRRRRSMSTSWSAASLSSMPPSSSSSAPSARAAALNPPPPLATPGAPGPLDCEPLSPRLALTVIPAAIDGFSGGGFPLCGSSHGAKLSTGNGGTTSADKTSVSRTYTGGHPAELAGLCRKLAALQGDRELEQKSRPIRQGEGAAEEAPMCFSGGVAPEATTAATVSRRVSGDGRNVAGDKETLSNVFGEADAGESELDGGGEREKTSPNREEQGQEQDRGERGPTQVLRVPEIATRHTEEYLGIQVRISLEVHTTPFWVGCGRAKVCCQKVSRARETSVYDDCQRSTLLEILENQNPGTTCTSPKRRASHQFRTRFFSCRTTTWSSGSET